MTPMFRTLAAFVVLFSLFRLPLRAETHPFLCCDYNDGAVTLVSADGRIEWRHPCKAPQDCWRLPNGHILLCHVAGVTEVALDHQVIWDYQAPKQCEVHSCQPLPNGRTLVVEGGTQRIVELDARGGIAIIVPLPSKPGIHAHNQYRGTRKLANGHYLVCFKGENRVVELDATGRELRSIPVAGDPHAAVPLENGRLLITCGDGHKVIEVDASGQTLWELNEQDIPGNPLRLTAGCQRLPNGNTVICNYLGHGHVGTQPCVFEITRDKRLVWSFRDDAHFKTINQIQLLDVPGNVIRGDIRR